MELCAIFSTPAKAPMSKTSKSSPSITVTGTINSRQSLHNNFAPRVGLRTSGKHHRSTSFFYCGLPPREIGRPRFSHSFLHGRPSVLPTPLLFESSRGQKCKTPQWASAFLMLRTWDNVRQCLIEELSPTPL